MVTSAGSEGADRASRGIRTMAAMTRTSTPIITIIARRSCRRIERSMLCAVWLFVSTRKGPLLDASSRCRHSTLDRSGPAGNRTRCLTSARKTVFPTELRERLGETLEQVDREDTFVYAARHWPIIYEIRDTELLVLVIDIDLRSAVDQDKSRAIAISAAT